MIIRRKWRIKNEYDKKAYLFGADIDDTAYLINLSNLAGWIDPGEVREVDVSFDQVKLGFRKGKVPVIDGWIAEPTKVSTTRDVVLTAEGTVAYRADSVEWRTPENGKLVYFISPAQANNIPRQLIVAALGKIPTVGGFISAIAGAIWTEVKDDAQALIFESERLMREWVRGEINDLKLEGLEDRLNALHINMNDFRNTKDPESQRIKLLNCLNEFVAAMTTFIKQDPRGLTEAQIVELRKKYAQGSAALAVEIGSLHIAALRERVVFAKQMQFPAVDHKLNEQELTDTIAMYQSFFQRVAVPAEIEWRSNMLTMTERHGTLGSNTYTIEDKVTRQVHRFSDQIRGNQRSTHESYVNRDLYLAQAKSSFANSLLTNVLDTAALWTLMDPAQSNARPIDLTRTTWVGPATGLVNKDGNEHGATRDQHFKSTGQITRIDVRGHDAVDYIKIFYKDGSSAAVGDATKGTLHTVSLAEGVHIKAIESWWDWELMGIQFHLSDGSKSPMIGKAKEHKQYSELPHHYVTGLQFEGKPDDKTAKRIGCAMSVAFQPVPDLYMP